MSTVTYHVSGLVCGLCIARLLEPMSALAGVDAVAVVRTGGESALTIVGAALPEPYMVRGVVEAAGFTLAGAEV